MSINKLNTKIVFAVFLVVLFSSLLGLSRQILVHIRINRRLAQKQSELNTLEKKNLELQKRLKQAQSPEFLQKQANFLLGEGEKPVSLLASSPAEIADQKEQATEEPKLSNSQKWWRLFSY